MKHAGMIIRMARNKIETLTATTGTDQSWTSVTGSPAALAGETQKRAFDVVDAPYETYVDVVNSQVTYYGCTWRLGAATSAEVFQIYRDVRTGSVTHRQYALNSAKFEFSWDNRTTYFTDPILTNPASLLFDGSNEDITLGDNYTFGPAIAFSWSLWMKAQNFSASRRFISKATQDANVYGYNFGHNASGKLFAQIRAPSSLPTHTFSTTLTAGTWYHICFTYDGSSNMSGLTAYIDGAAEPSPSSAGLNAWTVTDPLKIGSRGGTFYFSGNLNQVSVWNKALSSSEVTELYNSGSPGDLSTHSASANLLSWWLLNTATNFPTEIDQEGSINGTLVNMESSDYDELDVP